MRTLLLLLMSVAVSQASARPVKFAGTGNFYEVVFAPRPVSWEAAKRAAEQMTFQGQQGHLATVASAEENEFIRRLSEEAVAVHANNSDRIWLGGFQSGEAIDPANNWKWVNDEPWGYSNWGPLNKDDGAGQNCLVLLLPPKHQAGRWMALPKVAEADKGHGSIVGFVVEFSTVTGEPDQATIRQTVSEIETLLRTLTAEDVFGGEAEAKIERFENRLPRSVRNNSAVVAALSLTLIDRGIDPRRRLTLLSTRYRDFWPGWRIRFVSQLIFEDGARAMRSLSHYQEAVLAHAATAGAKDRAGCAKEITWIWDAAQTVTALPSVSDYYLDRLTSNVDASILMASDPGQVALKEREERRAALNSLIAKEKKQSRERRVLWLGEQIDRIAADLTSEWTAGLQSYDVASNDLIPLRTDLVAANELVNGLTSALATARLIAIRSLNTNDDDFEELREEQLEAEEEALELRAQLAIARATQTRAALTYHDKQNEIRTIIGAMASAVNDGRNAIVLLESEFAADIESDVGLEQRVMQLKNRITTVLKRLPRMPILKAQKTSKDRVKEKTQAIVRELDIDAQSVFAILKNPS